MINNFTKKEKSLQRIFLMLLCIFCYIGTIDNVYGQTPQAIPYQGVAYGADGSVVASQKISLRFTIHTGASTGPVVFSETHSITTTSLGLFDVNIGSGTIITGTLSGVNWGVGSKFIQVEMDSTGGVAYIDMGTTQLNSVPYALYAENANVPGLPGPQGPQGIQGEKGIQGDQGIQGVAGTNGIDGKDGAQGAKGDQGIQGIQGLAGTNGTDGKDGAQGVKGDQGIQGIQGEKGDKGDQGIQGVAGTNGADGKDGAQGVKGDQGIQGEKGEKGDVGLTGAVGPAPLGSGIVTVSGGVLNAPNGLTGDITTSGADLVTTLSNTGVIAGTYSKVVVDSKGRITEGKPATTADIIPSTDKNYVSDKQLAAIMENTSDIALKANIAGQVFTGVISAPNLSGTNTGDQDLSVYATKEELASEKQMLRM